MALFMWSEKKEQAFEATATAQQGHVRVQITRSQAQPTQLHSRTAQVIESNTQTELKLSTSLQLSESPPTSTA